MKYIFLTLVFLFLSQQVSAEKIQNFDVEIVVDDQGNLTVTETIVYDFEGASRHGIFREIPENFKPTGNLGSIDVDFQSVTNQHGRVRPTQDESGMGTAKMRIGDPDIYVSGVETYVITYTVRSVMGFLGNIEELYWNVTGNKWEVPIEAYSISVQIPQDKDRLISMYSYCGPLGSNQRCSGKQSKGPHEIVFLGLEALQPGEGATIDLEFMKGTFIAPTIEEYIIFWIREFWGMILAPFAAWFLMRKKIKMFRKRREFYRKNPVGVEYDPGGTTLMEASYFHDGKFELDNVGAFIVWAAIRKYLRIEEVDKKKYTFTLLHENFDQANDLSDNQRNILELLEKLSPLGGKKKEKLSYIKVLFKQGSSFDPKKAYTLFIERALQKKELYKKNIAMIQATYEHLAESGHISYEKKISKMTAPVGGSARFATAFIFLFLAVNPGIFLWVLYVPLGVFFSALMVILAGVNLVSRRTVHYTEKGFSKERQIKGLYKYIDMAEKDRMNMLNQKSATPELYEKLLPYAIIFGLEKKWTKSFGDLIQYNPDWYASRDGNPISMIQLTQQMSSIGQAVSSAGAPSSSGRSSGSGGGGSSGGGGGGGGGGSW